MNNSPFKIDLLKLIKYVLKRIWLPVLCAAIGFVALYGYTKFMVKDTYTASGTMYVYNSNPNLINYQYASSGDLSSAVMLIDTYLVVVKSNKVMDVVAERLAVDYPGITPGYISGTLSMASVSETGVVKVTSTTNQPQLSADICNAVLDVAPAEIIRVVSAGNIEVIDYAETPISPNYRNARSKGVFGALIGAVLAVALLVILYLFNRKIVDTKDLEDNYTPPVLTSVKRYKKNSDDAGDFMLTDKSEMEMLEGYAKLRMNMLYTMIGKDSKTVIVTSAISGEGKSTIASNLAISCARAKKKVLLVDSDLRRACQKDIFSYDKNTAGLSEVLIGKCRWEDAVIKNIRESMDLLPAGMFPPNPAELLGSREMKEMLLELEKVYELIILDMPPANIVTDPLVLSENVAGCIFIVRQNYSDHRDIRKALIAAEMTGMNVLGFVFYGENISESSYYNRRYYKSYYHKYDYRKSPVEVAALQKEENVTNIRHE